MIRAGACRPGRAEGTNSRPRSNRADTARLWQILFIPIYFWCSFHAWRIGRDYYRDNFFEVEAYDNDH